MERKSEISATIIADSLGPFGDRIITYILTFPRIVLAEFNTHRALSRNSASSRAIPSKKMLKMVQENPFIPIKWMKEHTGMQGTEYFDDPYDIGYFIMNHLDARDYAVHRAIAASEKGLSKQICNRYLEPFMWHTCICTATEWENFFALRAHPDAEIHIQDLAHKMLEAANVSTPNLLKPYEWHIPFGDKIDKPLCKREILSNGGTVDWIPVPEIDGDWVVKWQQEQRIKIATARCARVSYLNFEGKDDYLADVKLYNRLLKAGHMSPFEHCAQVIDEEHYKLYPWSGNFKGFRQLRKSIENENKKDERLVRKS